MQTEILEIQPMEDNVTKLESPNKKDVRPFNLKKWLKNKKANERYAILLLSAAIFINLIALIYQSSGDFLLPTDNARLAVFFWAFSVVLAGLSAWFFTASSRKTKKDKAKTKAKRKLKSELQNLPFLIRVRGSILAIVQNKDFLALFPILLFAFILRIIPIMGHGLFLDEWYWLDNAKSILNGTVVSPFGFIGDQPSNFGAYPLAFLLLIVRNPLLAVRLIGIIYSLIATALVYFLGKKIMGFKAAVCGSLLMAVSVWDIHMSGLGWLNVSSNPMLVAAVLLVLYRIWERKYTIWTLFGLAFLAAINLHLLYITALLVLPVGLVLLAHWIKNRSWKAPKEIILFGLFFFVCVSPLFPKLIIHPESFIRHDEFIQYNLDKSGESETTLGYYLGQILLLGEDYFRGEADYNDQAVWGMTFDPLVQGLSVLGILLIFIQVFRKKCDLFWLVVIFIFFVQLVVPLVLFYRTTSAWRAYPVLPIVYLFAMFALVEISRSMKLITKKMIINRKGLLTIFLAANMALYFMINSYWFYHFFSSYTKTVDRYENTICETAAKIIGQNVPRDTTIYMPDEMCFSLVSILFDENHYHFIAVRSEDPKLNMVSGDYVMFFNSRQYLGPFNSDEIEAKILNELGEQNMELISSHSDSLPVLYLIK